MLLLLSRLLHIVCGCLWVGMAVFSAFYLGPAIDDAGPGANAVMPALARRGIATIFPALGLVTILSGGWLYARVMGDGAGAASATGVAHAYLGSALVAVIAFLVGILVTRPAMAKAAAAFQAAATAAPEQRGALLAEGARLKARGSAGGKIGGALLLVALAGMSVARYL